MTTLSSIPAVTTRWTEYRDELAARYPALLPFFEQAARFPKIAVLFPFLSMGRLCFSRCTRYPFFVDFIVCVTSEGEFLVERTDGRGGWVEGREIGRGDAAVATRLLVDSIPADYGAAIEGTGDDIRHDIVA